VEQENTGQHRGSGPVFGVKLKWTSAGLQNQRLQVRGLALRPVSGVTKKPFHLISCLEDMAVVHEYLLRWQIRLSGELTLHQRANLARHEHECETREQQQNQNG
jgi:hypothetical protein